MHPLRHQVKSFLLGQYKACALCGKPATQLHEVICPLKHKYNPCLEDALARLVYSPVNCVLLCSSDNIIVANSRRDNLIRFNMGLYGVDSVVGVYRSMAKLLKCPISYIPSSIEFEGKIVRIL
jgi:hypothetical protein